jgi:hypothetical protein
MTLHDLTQGRTATVAIVEIATLCRAISSALQDNFKISRAHLQGNFKISRAYFIKISRSSLGNFNKIDNK